MKLVHFLNKIEINDQKPAYECCVCGKLFNWHNDAFWYGSLNMLEFNKGNYIKHLCSSECKRKFDKQISKK